MIAVDGDAIDEIRLANTLRLFPDMDHDDVDLAYRAIRRFSRLCDSPGDCGWLASWLAAANSIVDG